MTKLIDGKEINEIELHFHKLFVNRSMSTFDPFD